MEREDKRKILVQYLYTKLIDKDKQHFFNGGCLFLQQIYYSLGLKYYVPFKITHTFVPL